MAKLCQMEGKRWRRDVQLIGNVACRDAIRPAPNQQPEQFAPRVASAQKGSAVPEGQKSCFVYSRKCHEADRIAFLAATRSRECGKGSVVSQQIRSIAAEPVRQATMPPA